MHREAKDYLDLRRKRFVLEYVSTFKSVKQGCQELDVPKSTYYDWKKAFDQYGQEGLIRKKPKARSHPKQLSPDAIEKILYLRKSFFMGSQRIKWYLERYHGITTSESTVYRTLVRHNMGKMPKTVRTRAMHTKRYSKKTPGHHIQVDVKFIKLEGDNGKKVNRFQYTAIDDTTRIRALKIYPKHTQKNAIDFIDEVIEKFPFRIHTIRTDRGHEFQAQFHWHVEDLGLTHVYIKPRSPQLNGKVERSHRTDQQEFYQLLSYTDDVDLKQKLEKWEEFYNFHRPHGAFNGQTPYEVLRSILVSQ